MRTRAASYSNSHRPGRLAVLLDAACEPMDEHFGGQADFVDGGDQQQTDERGQATLPDHETTNLE